MIPATWQKESEKKDRQERWKKRNRGVTEKGIEKAIQEAFRLKHRILLVKTDAGGVGVKGLHCAPPAWLLEALGILPLPWGLSAALLIPPGFPDLTGRFRDRWVFVEVKKPGGAFREGQKDFLLRARDGGHIAFSARSVDEALSKFSEQSREVAA